MATLPSIFSVTLASFLHMFNMEPQKHLHIKNNDIYCLATGIYFESRVKNYEEAVGIGYVIKTRAKEDARYKGSYCKVFHAPYQFMTNEIKAIHKQSKFEPEAWSRAIWIAYGVHYGTVANPYPGAQYFCNPKTTKVRWCHNSVGKMMGSHLFVLPVNFNKKNVKPVNKKRYTS